MGSVVVIDNSLTPAMILLPAVNIFAVYWSDKNNMFVLLEIYYEISSCLDSVYWSDWLYY